MFLWAPSGLVIYWTVSNIWGIGQQMITNRIIGPAVVRDGAAAGGAAGEDAPAAARRSRRQGAQVMNCTSGCGESRQQTAGARWGCRSTSQVIDTPDAIRVEISGDGGEVLLQRKGEALDALQQIVNTGVPPRAERRPLASSSTAWATARARTPS